MRVSRSASGAAGSAGSTGSSGSTGSTGEPGEPGEPAAALADAVERAMPRRRPDRVQRLLGAAAAVLVLGGLALVGGAGLDVWSRVHRIEASQAKLARAVDAEWPPLPARPAGGGGAATAAVPAAASGAAAQGMAGEGPAAQGGAPARGTAGEGPDVSGALARLHIPRLRLDLVVVEGSDDADLLRGPGHIPGTPLFGQPGNVGIAGHRYPGVFWDLDRLHTGDPVVVETAQAWYVYRVDQEMIVDPSDVEVLSPHPAGAPAGARGLVTLVTCDPVFTTLHRLIRQAVLVRTMPRADGPPPELAG